MQRCLTHYWEHKNPCLPRRFSPFPLTKTDFRREAATPTLLLFKCDTWDSELPHFCLFVFFSWLILPTPLPPDASENGIKNKVEALLFEMKGAARIIANPAVSVRPQLSYFG